MPAGETWESAYARFETPAQERRKFVERLTRLGARDWPKTEAIGEMFCGRGSGLDALSDLGFKNLMGVDISPTLLAQYEGTADTLLADCRNTGLANASFDRIIVHGGLHHLEKLPADLVLTLDEFARVLKPDGHLVIVEPWSTPFLKLVHWCLQRRLARRSWQKLDALAVMTELEAPTYFNWLSRPEEIRNLLAVRFEVVVDRVFWGKLYFVGRKRDVKLRERLRSTSAYKRGKCLMS